ncbi:MAG TPA: ribosome-associated translation inhibitor RaiA [Candidatus Saccharimonadales bacterium]|nr:ribosome-associated translation inhibitor RaiA [Candidatus Saccharimonadales bacterium]
MNKHIDITGIRYTPDEATKRYVMRKIGSLDRFLNRHARKTMYADVKLRQVDRKRGNKYECEVTLTIPDATLNAMDSTMNMLAAVDIVEEKLKNQLKRYAEEKSNHRGRHSVLAKVRSRAFRPKVY